MRNKETKIFEIHERFVEFLNFNGKTGESIAIGSIRPS